MYTCFDCGRLFVSNYDYVNHNCTTQDTIEKARHITEQPKELNHHEQSLNEFASECGDDESIWGYDGDVW